MNTQMNLKLVLLISLFISFNCFGQDSNTLISSQFTAVKKVLNRRTGIVNNLCVTVSESTKEYSMQVKEIIKSSNEINQYMVAISSLDSISIATLYKKNIDLTQKLGKLMVVIEGNKELQMNQDFMDFTAQLAGCENRICIECIKYNELCTEQKRPDLTLKKECDYTIPKVKF